MHMHGALNTHTRYIVYMDILYTMFIRQLYDACINGTQCNIKAKIQKTKVQSLLTVGTHAQGVR